MILATTSATVPPLRGTSAPNDAARTSSVFVRVRKVACCRGHVPASSCPSDVVRPGDSPKSDGQNKRGSGGEMGEEGPSFLAPPPSLMLSHSPHWRRRGGWRRRCRRCLLADEPPSLLSSSSFSPPPPIVPAKSVGERGGERRPRWGEWHRLRRKGRAAAGGGGQGG